MNSNVLVVCHANVQPQLWAALAGNSVVPGTESERDV